MRIAIQVLATKVTEEDDERIVKTFEHSTLMEVVGDVLAQLGGELDRLSVSIHRPEDER